MYFYELPMLFQFCVWLLAFFVSVRVVNIKMCNVFEYLNKKNECILEVYNKFCFKIVFIPF